MVQCNHVCTGVPAVLNILTVVTVILLISPCLHLLADVAAPCTSVSMCHCCLFRRMLVSSWLGVRAPSKSRAYLSNLLQFLDLHGL